MFNITADINSLTNINGVVANVLASGSTVLSSNGDITNMVGSNVTGASHDVATNTFKIISSIPTTKDLATDAMEFTLTAFGTDIVTLSGATFNNILSGYTGSTTLTVIRKSDNAVLGTATGSTGFVSFSTNNTIAAGTSVTYIVKVVGAVIDPISTPNWSVSMTSLIMSNNLDTASYPINLETLPLTSVK